jgi:lysine N6-hydroxylase
MRFFGLDPETRRTLLVSQRLASDGISVELLQQIYQSLYQLECTGRAGGHSPVVLPEWELVRMEPRGDRWILAIRHVGTGQVRTETADVVVLATGYTHDLPDYLKPILGRIRFDGQHPSVRADFSLVWDGPDDARIYVQNAARHSHGVADPNLSLVAWRSAVIVNSLLGEDRYDVTEPPSMITWENGRHERREEAHVGREQ